MEYSLSPKRVGNHFKGVLIGKEGQRIISYQMSPILRFSAKDAYSDAVTLLEDTLLLKKGLAYERCA